MSGLRDQCCNHAKIRGRVADALPAFASGAMRHPPCLKKNPLPLKSDRGQRVEPLMAR